jgi:prevent-host-death family protein
MASLIGSLVIIFNIMQSSRSVSVSELKNKLLEVVRLVQQGEVFEITKAGQPVATLAPSGRSSRSATGFARVEVKGSLDLPAGDWTYDIENLKMRGKARK